MSITAQHLINSKPNLEIHAVRPDQSTYDALRLMAEKNVGAVFVMQNATPLGILTERDYARKIVLHGKTSRHTPVGETMNPDFPKVAPSATLDDCMRMISDTRCRYVAVMDGERLLGLISIGDIIKHIILQQQADIDHLQRYITGG